MTLKDELNEIKEKRLEELRQKSIGEQRAKQERKVTEKTAEKTVSPMVVFMKDYKNGIFPQNWEQMLNEIIAKIKTYVKKDNAINKCFNIDMPIEDKKVIELFKNPIKIGINPKIKKLFFKWLKKRLKDEDILKIKIAFYNHKTKFYSQEDYDRQEEEQGRLDAIYMSEMKKFSSPSMLYDSPPTAKEARLHMTGVTNNYGIIVQGMF